MATLVEVFEDYVRRPDVSAHIEQFPMQHPFVMFLAQIGAAITCVAQSPPSPGYEPYFTDLNCNWIAARGLAALAVRVGQRRARDAERERAVVDAIRFLAKPGRRRRWASRRVNILLLAWEETSVIETIFAEARIDEFEFIRLLKRVAERHEPVSVRLTEVAAAVAPRLSLRHGPKVCPISASHEHFVQTVAKLMNGRPRPTYTWSPVKEEFTDKLTQATRREFVDYDFDPRTACQRARAQPIQ